MNERHRQKRLNAIRLLLALPRSIWFNLRLLPLHQAVRLPLFVSHRARIENIGGKVVLDTPEIKPAIVQIGFNTCQCSDFRHDRTCINLRGQWTIGGKCRIGAGSSIEVSETGLLTTGHDFNLGPKSLIICHHKILFGDDDLTSWCCTFMDTDQHTLIDGTGRPCNPDRPVTVGDNVWFGCHTIVTKGATLAPDTTVGAGACVAGHFTERETVLAGVPARVVKRGLKRNDGSK